MRSINRTGLVSGTGLIVTGLTATLVALVFPIWSYADRSGTGVDTSNAQTVSTQFGPLSALDREFVTKVRLAGPVGAARGPAGRGARHHGGRTDRRRAPRRGPHVPGRARPQRRRAARPRAAQPAQRAAARVADHAERGARRGLRPRVREHPPQGPRQGLLASSPRSARTPATRSYATSPTTRTPPCSTTSRSSRPPGYVDFDALARDAATAAPPPITNSPAPPGPTRVPELPDPGLPVPGLPLPRPPPRPTRPRSRQGPDEPHERKAEHHIPRNAPSIM